MKFHALAAICAACVLLCGCGTQTAEPETAETTAAPAETTAEVKSDAEQLVIEGTDAKTVMLGDGTVYLILEDEALIEKTSEGLVWDYLSSTLRLTFPDNWLNRFSIRGTSVYCKACFNPDDYSGELFSINFVDEKSMASGPRYDALLGVYRGMYVTAKRCENPNYDETNTEMLAEYTDMANDLSRVFSSAVVSTNQDYKPVLLDDYAPVTPEDHSKLLGCWNQSDAAGNPNADFYPYAVFRGRDSAFGYKYGANDLAFGSFLVNRKAKDYVWNTDNWGDAGLVFVNGCAYRVTYFESAPMTLRFELISGDPENDVLSASGFAFDRDYQEIHQSGDDEPEIEF